MALQPAGGDLTASYEGIELSLSKYLKSLDMSRVF